MRIRPPVRRPVLAVTLVAAWLLAACGGDDVPAGPVSTPPSSVAVPTAAPPDTEGVAVWPEDTVTEIEAATAAGPAEYRSTRLGTAVAFGRDVLSWADAETAEYDGPVECGVGGCVIVRRPGGAQVLLSMQQFVEGVWSVQSVSQLGPGEDGALSLGVTGTQVTAVFDLGDATSAEFVISYGDRTATHTYTQDQDTESWDLGFEPADDGHFIILFEGADGSVIAAQGSPLPAGDFAAG